MRRQDERSGDERLRKLFQELRREEERAAPPFRSLRWVRRDPETRPTRMRRLAVAGSVGVVVTAVFAAIAVSPRLKSPPLPVSAEQSERFLTVRNYVLPPPALVERRAWERRAVPTREDSVASSSTASPSGSQPASERVERRPAGSSANPSTAAEASRRGTAGALGSQGYVGAVAPAGPEALRRAAVAMGAEQRKRVEFDTEHGVAGSQTATVTTFGDETVQDLPVQGRFHTTVLTLPPADENTGGDGDPNVHGARGRDFTTLVGGVRNVDPRTGLRYGNVNVDSIEEIEDLTASAGFEHGRAQGGFANSIEKHSGDRSEGLNTESYAAIRDNPFHVVADEPLSTFSADVDTASYSNVRRFLREGRRPPRDAVRIEELINYFDYDHPAPRGKDPFGVAAEVADCPWNQRHRLARITLAARRETRDSFGGSNLVFLLDVSGSMEPSNKLPLVKQAMTMLAGQLDGRDTVSIVVYAGASGLVLPPTAGSDRTAILESLERLEAGGSTAGAEGLRLAYRTARDNFVEGGVNRVILATDGDFNVGVRSHAELLRIIEKDAQAGIFLTALGFGMDNYQDDRLEQLADAGNGNYAYIDDLSEARKVLVEEIGGTLVTVAKDVKLQVEFNPKEVGAYRLIGYENRLLAHRDFNDDTRDAGEIGAGHTVTVLYELVPPGELGTGAEVDPLRYRRQAGLTEAADRGELFTLKVRFKPPHGSESELRIHPVMDDGLTLGGSSDDFRFAAAVAAFGMRLREAAAVRDFGWDDIEHLAGGAAGADPHGHRSGFVDLVRKGRDAMP